MLSFNLLLSSLLFPILLLYAGALPIMAAMSTTPPPPDRGNETDLQALLAIKSEILHDPTGIMRSWNDSLLHCKWPGVACGLRHGRVTGLDLFSKGLVGNLSPFIGNLSFLHDIVLGNNSFTGNIPPQIGRLFRLQGLGLQNNSFQGEIPANLSRCSNLEVLFIGYNNLEGRLPMELGSLSKLVVINVYGNNLTGDISVIGNLTSLRSIEVSFNAFRGSVPEKIGEMRDLYFLRLIGNKFSGTIPPSIYNLSSLTDLGYAYNQIEGSLPTDLGLRLPKLRSFIIQSNNLSGPLPITLSNLTLLEYLCVSINSFSGKIRVDARNMPNLIDFLVEKTNLGLGEMDDLNFMNTFVNCTFLQMFSVAANNLGGILPPSVANFSKTLSYLGIEVNQISGPLPNHLDNLANLYFFTCDGNRLSGSLPPEIGKLSKLSFSVLSFNEFSGTIPSSFGNLSQLSRIDLSHNRLQGEIPSTFAHCTRLVYLGLSSNNLTGKIPYQLFYAPALSVGLLLDGNRLYGSLPPEVGLLIKLAMLDISSNELSGTIPENLGSCTSLTSLNMGDNMFHGDIPSVLSSLRGLEYLNLSHNNLSGKIPSYFSTFALEGIDLSFNNFDGEVPVTGVFSNATAVLLDHNKLCGGITELHLPKCTTNDGPKGRRNRLFFILVASVPIILFATAIIILALMLSRKKTRHSSLGLTSRDSFVKISYDMLLKATDAFSPTNLVGVGGFGSVYRGHLNLDDNRVDVAVKVLDLQNSKASMSFTAECDALRNIRHRNLVSIISSCSSIDHKGNEFKALIFKLMPNGSLEIWLHPEEAQDKEHARVPSLSLLQRVDIAIDIASAVEYLHYSCETPVVHCDLKPSNILLDENMVAHVGDFGLAKFLLEHKNHEQSSSMGVRGTIGYAAPEYGVDGLVSVKADVYSFGIILLEMMTGMRPTHPAFANGLGLHKFAELSLSDQVMENIADARMLHEDSEAAHSNTSQGHDRFEKNDKLKCIASILKIGVACSVDSPHGRMDVRDAIKELKLARDMLFRLD